jgi:hypothetical protein
MEPERIKVSTAAKMLSVTPLTIRRGIYAGRIPCIRTETGRVFLPMSWVNQQAGKTPPSDLEELISKITSYCMRNHGQEDGKVRAKKIIEIISHE